MPATTGLLRPSTDTRNERFKFIRTVLDAGDCIILRDFSLFDDVLDFEVLVDDVDFPVVGVADDDAGFEVVTGEVGFPKNPEFGFLFVR